MLLSVRSLLTRNFGASITAPQHVLQLWLLLLQLLQMLLHLLLILEGLKRGQLSLILELLAF